MKHVAPDDSSPTTERPAPELDSRGSTRARGPLAESAQEGASFELDPANAPLTEPPSEAPADMPIGDLERDPTVISQRPVAAPGEFVRSISLVELARSLEGRQLDHFAVGRMIGGGGMGAVFRGRDLRLDRDVAIKVIPESRRDPETLRRFRMEAQSAARLDHPNIARVYDIGEDEVWNYIVFEFIDGINLRDLVQMEGPMTIDDAVFTTRQVAEALQHAHDRDVVHRDIKPSNVIITPTGIAKVVDMGLARNTAMDRSSADQTASGVTLGTFDYISPEQARDPRDADVRSDLYSLGCTLFYMLTGQPPFPDGTALQKLLNHGSQPPPDPRLWRDDISDQLYAVLAKLMAKRPADRYQKPLELINDLLLIAQLEGLPRSRSPGSILLRATVAQRTLLETHLPWMVPMAVVLVSAFWLQSVDSLSSSLELSFSTLRPPQANASSDLDHREGPASSSSVGSQRAALADPLRQGTGSGSLPAVPGTPNAAGPTVIEPPPRSELLDSPAVPPAALPPRGTRAPSTALGPVTPLKKQASEILDLTEGGVSASAAQAMDDLRDRISRSPRSPTTSGGEMLHPTTTAGSSPLPASPLGPTNPALAGSAALGSKPENAESIAGNVEPRLPSPLARDTIVVSASEPSDLSSNARWETSLSQALARAANAPEVRIIELRESIELNQIITIPRSGLTLRGASARPVEVVLDGEQAYGMGWETWIDVQHVSLRCQRLHFVCRNNMRQAQAIFALRAGGQLELTDCMATMASNHNAPLGSCVLVTEPERQRDLGLTAGTAIGSSSEDSVVPSLSTRTSSITSGLSSDAMPLPPSGAAPTTPSSATADLLGSTAGSAAGLAVGGVSGDGEPVAIALRNCVVRGHQNLVSMRTACRAEITLDETCAMLEGRVLTIRGSEHDRMPPVVRLNMEFSTLVSRQGFAHVQTGFALRAPLTLMRTAKLCAFWSPSMVPHIVVDGIADQDVLDELLQLRGEENAYDQNIETLCQCRFADGKHIDFSFRDATGEWFRERGNDNSLRWQSPVPPDRPWEEQMPEDYRLRAGMFMPGFPPSAGIPPQLDSNPED